MNGNTEHQYLRARYYDTDTANFFTEDSYLGKTNDPLTLNRYSYVKSSPLNYIDPSGYFDVTPWITSGEQLRDWLPNKYQITTMGSAYDDWVANYVNSTSDEEKWLLILEMQVIVKENEEKLKGVNSYNELEKLLKEADLKGQTERCMDILNELSTMVARDIGGFIIGVIDSLMGNFFVIPLYYEMVVAHIFGYDSFIEKAKRTEQILIDDYFTEYGYKMGQEFGNILSLLGAVGLWYFGAMLKSGAFITAKAGVATGPAAPGVAALSALAVIIGELIQIWSLTVATAAVSNAMYSQFNSQNSSSSSSGSGNSSGDNKGTAENNYNWDDESTLEDHFYDHGEDFDATSPRDYAKQANDFYNNRGNYKTKVDMYGNIRVYDPKTNTFGSYNSDGSTRTFFKPTDPVTGRPSGSSYFNSQPGK